MLIAPRAGAFDRNRKPDVSYALVNPYLWYLYSLDMSDDDKLKPTLGVIILNLEAI